MVLLATAAALYGPPTALSAPVTWHSATASWYGSELFGNLTACGQTYGPDLLGVAHKSFRCGTKIRFLYRGRKVTVRVVDRGPYVAGRTFDLTHATAKRLRFDGVQTVKWRRGK